jgi:hypothetical protein
MLHGLTGSISRQHVDSEADIDWVKLASGIFSGLPSEALRNAYKAMKHSLKLEPNTSFEGESGSCGGH